MRSVTKQTTMLDIERLELLKKLLESGKLSREEQIAIAFLVQEQISRVGCNRQNCNYIAEYGSDGVYEYGTGSKPVKVSKSEYLIVDSDEDGRKYGNMFACEFTKTAEKMQNIGFPLKQKSCPYKQLTFEEYLIKR